VRASSEEEFERAARFRRDVFLDRSGVVFDEKLEARRDREGSVFLLLEGTAMVATGRLLPYPSRLSPVRGLMTGEPCRGADSEIGRIAAIRSSSLISYALVLLVLGSFSIIDDDLPWKRYVAYCDPKLVGLYRLIGAGDTGRECVVPGRSRPHRIVTGTFEDAAHIGGSLLGLTTPPARSPLRKSA
jgi:hypothetical protein